MSVECPGSSWVMESQEESPDTPVPLDTPALGVTLTDPGVRALVP